MKYFFNNKRQREKGTLPSTLSYLHKTVPMSSCMQGMRGWLALSWEEELSFHSRGTCPICGWEANVRPHGVSTTGVRQGPIAERDKPTRLTGVTADAPVCAWLLGHFCREVRARDHCICPDYSFSSFGRCPHPSAAKTRSAKGREPHTSCSQWINSQINNQLTK